MNRPISGIYSLACANSVSDISSRMYPVNPRCSSPVTSGNLVASGILTTSGIPNSSYMKADSVFPNNLSGVPNRPDSIGVSPAITSSLPSHVKSSDLLGLSILPRSSTWMLSSKLLYIFVWSRM